MNAEKKSIPKIIVIILLGFILWIIPYEILAIICNFLLIAIYKIPFIGYFASKFYGFFTAIISLIPTFIMLWGINLLNCSKREKKSGHIILFILFVLFCIITQLHAISTIGKLTDADPNFFPAIILYITKNRYKDE